jgi:hypothetical protein
VKLEPIAGANIILTNQSSFPKTSLSGKPGMRSADAEKSMSCESFFRKIFGKNLRSRVALQRHGIGDSSSMA